MAIDYDTTVGQVRLLLNDVDESDEAGGLVFTDAEVQAFLAMEGDQVKLAAAQAIDTNADDQALASKVLRTQDLSTDGTKVADSLRRRAASLRAQHAAERAEAEDADGGYFEIVDLLDTDCARPELTGW